MKTISKKILLLGAIMLSISSNLYADDSPFSGPYVGAHLSRVEASMTQEDSDCWFNCSAYTQNADSFGYGIQGGYNWVNENLLLGVEARYTAGGPDETFEAGYYNNPPEDMKYTSELKNLLSLRFRTGLVLNKTAIILSAGLAQGDFDHEFRDQRNSGEDPSDDDVARYSGDTSGWVTGIGIEHAFTDHILVGVGYSQYSFDTEQSNVIGDNGTGTNFGYIVKFVDTANTFDISVSYTF